MLEQIGITIRVCDLDDEDIKMGSAAAAPLRTALGDGLVTAGMAARPPSRSAGENTPDSSR